MELGCVHILRAKFGRRDRCQQALVSLLKEDVLRLDPVHGIAKPGDLVSAANQELNPPRLFAESLAGPFPDLTDHPLEIIVSRENDEVRGVGHQRDLLIWCAGSKGIRRVVHLVPPVSQDLTACLIDVLVDDESKPETRCWWIWQIVSSGI